MIYYGTGVYGDVAKCWDGQNTKLFFLGDHNGLYGDLDMSSQMGGRSLPGIKGNAMEKKER